MSIKARYIVDADGEPVEVILPIAAYRKLMAAISKSDPDAGHPLKKSFADELLRQEKEYAAGKRGKPWAQVKRELGLE
jgi:hypothetical protein